MDVKQGADLERRLTARLRPARVLGAEETWARIAPTLDRGGQGRWRVLPALGVACAALLVIAMAGALVFTFQETNTGGMGSQPGAPTATAQRPVAMAGSMAVVEMGTNGSLITGLAPTPPFTVFQPGALPSGMNLIASAYNPAPLGTNQPVPATGGIGSIVNGPGPDVALMQAATQRSQQLLGDGHEVILALIYAASADDQLELVQRSAAGKMLPAGEPLTVHGLPATKAQRDGRTVITWIEAGTYLEFAVTSPAPERLQLANSLRETTLAAPTAIPATPVLGGPITGGGVSGTGGGVPATGAVPAWSNVPLSQRRGTVSVPQPDWATITQQCGAWAVTPNTTASPSSFEQVICTARMITGLTGDGGYGFSFFTWNQAAEQLGLDPATGPASDPQVWLVTMNTLGGEGSALVLDAASGTAIVQVQLLPVP